jgi:DNA modification methylase
MKIQQVNVEKLIPFARNSRTHSDKQVAEIAASIKEFGWTNPILVDGDKGIIAGHGRLLAARKLGMDTVPVIELAHLTETQKRAYVIADNKLALNADWDDQLLTIELNDLLADGFALELLGFDKDELAKLLEPEQIEGLTDEDAVPEVPDEPVTKLGDVWILGNHRLMCGDSTSIDAVEKLMAGQKADMVFTDPPYNQNTQRGGGGELGKQLRAQSDKIEFICDFDPTEFLNVLPSVFAVGINAYIFCNKDLLPDYLIWAKNNDYSFWVLVWKKEGGIPINSAHRPDIEYLLVFRKKSIFNSGIKGINYSRLLEVNRARDGLHPTMKPIELIENQLQIGSNTKSIVADLFGGSGSTLIACEKTSRHARLMELDPKYCDVIVKRWQDFTGKVATLEATKEPFSKLKQAA